MDTTLTAIRPAASGRRPATRQRFTTRLAVASLLLAAVALLAGQARAAEPLQAFAIDYDIYRGDMRIAQAHYALTVDGQRYTYRAVAKPKGFLAKLLLGNMEAQEESTGMIMGNGALQPLRYYQHPGDAEKVEVAQFLWQQTPPVVDLSYKNKQQQLPLTADLTDKLSMQLAAMRALHNGATGALTFRAAERGKITDYRFEIKGMETVSTPMGDLPALRIEQKTSERRSSFWLAPSLGYAIIRGEQQKKDDPIILLSMRKLEGQPYPAARR